MKTYVILSVVAALSAASLSAQVVPLAEEDPANPDANHLVRMLCFQGPDYTGEKPDAEVLKDWSNANFNSALVINQRIPESGFAICGADRYMPGNANSQVSMSRVCKFDVHFYSDLNSILGTDGEGLEPISLAAELVNANADFVLEERDGFQVLQKEFNVNFSEPDGEISGKIVVRYGIPFDGNVLNEFIQRIGYSGGEFHDQFLDWRGGNWGIANYLYCHPMHTFAPDN